MRDMAIVSDLCAHRVQRASRNRVGGTVMGDFYKDDQGGMWKYEYKSSGYAWGQTRASTDKYGGITTDWYDQSAFNSHPDALNAKMDTTASTWTDTSVDSPTSGDTGPTGGGDSTPADTTPGGGDTTPSTTPKPKAGMTAKPAPKAGGGAPVAKASSSTGIVVAALIAIPLAIGALWAWKSSAAASGVVA